MAYIMKLLCVLLLCGCTRACLGGWKKDGDYCFMFSHNQVTWSEAESICQLFDSKLAEPQTAEMDTFIGSQAVKNQRKYWLGGSDIMQEGYWKWMSTLEPMVYTHWHAPDPNNGNQGEDCLLNNWYGAGRWADGECEWKEFYICQRIDDSVSTGVIG
ncbi:perlucin-like protein [Mizuhopecten yessoensis]|uniref:Perlucin-like protein n=1 Tax=Mizuhopecten yessoensis TaxID=6573 RepID=A0A210Q2B4_MIZYE|nr:perlucin-like protein [Mizuhopecten yessoensis]OWF42845.1 Perlucin-like protein [Mizuhopecten yessoensis]